MPAHGELEGLLLAGAAAIQALVAERDRLRSRVNLSSTNFCALMRQIRSSFTSLLLLVIIAEG